ncbi:TPA: hypothetical protein ACGO9W_002196, partial [Streptococcus suis]
NIDKEAFILNISNLIIEKRLDTNILNINTLENLFCELNAQEQISEVGNFTELINNVLMLILAEVEYNKERQIKVKWLTK